MDRQRRRGRRTENTNIDWWRYCLSSSFPIIIHIRKQSKDQDRIGWNRQEGRESRSERGGREEYIWCVLILPHHAITLEGYLDATRERRYQLLTMLKPAQKRKEEYRLEQNIKV